MFERFENLVETYPMEEPRRPPDRLLSFVLFYAKPLLPLLLWSSVLVAVLSLLEVAFFWAMGNLVDWLSVADKETFVSDYWGLMTIAAAAVLIGFPLLSLLHGLLAFQSIIGNFPQRVRWQAHRYILGQSLDFFQDEFAGRVSQKVMQTALAVRDACSRFSMSGSISVFISSAP